MTPPTPDKDELERIFKTWYAEVTGLTNVEFVPDMQVENLLSETLAWHHKKIDEATNNINHLIAKARLDELNWGKSQVCDLPKSHVGKSFYTRNTAFKNYAVKFWNNRVKLIRNKFDDRRATLEQSLKE